MNILVCVKQVPGSSAVKVDEKTGLLIRPKKGNKLNPYDLFAIQTALDLKARDNSDVAILTMGPPQAMDAINECLWMGCDDGYLITDRVFGGADVLATSYTISQGIKKAGNFDLILCGKQTTDGDTAQVGAEVAEHLGIAHLSNVISILDRDETSITVKALQENLVVTEVLDFPCLLCMDSDINTPSLPSYKRMKALGDTTAKVLTFADFEDQDKTHYGLKGSPTQVQKVFPPEKNENRVLYNGTDEKLALKLKDILEDLKFI